MIQAGLFISRADLNRIELSAWSSLPRECCGILLGARIQAGWRVSAIAQSRNAAPPERTDRFEIDPALLLHTQKAARAGGPNMIGVYHSHPNGAAEPSQTDLAAAWQIGMIWLITALHAKQAETCAYLRQEDGFVPVRLQIEETTA